ncbi:MAG: PEP-CTERM sorting domain-containing protein [Nitrosomonas sp.]|nr:PEP-CTERM sorting domain-containing protein [Nitrosomonas sp.]
MKKIIKLTNAVFVVVSLFVITDSFAAIVNFANETKGIVFQGSTQVGTINATFHYNLRDKGINALGSNDITRSDKFPDKMKVECLAGLQNNGDLCDPIGAGGVNNTNAYQSWGFNPLAPTAANPEGEFGIASYTPFSAFQDEYFVTVKLNLTAGSNIGSFSESFDINKITIYNNIESSVWRDEVQFDTAIGLFRFIKEEFPLSVPPIPQIPPLTSIYLEDALIALPGLNADDFFSFGFRNTAYFGSFNDIGPLLVPEPSTIYILLLGLIGLLLTRSRNLLNFLT